MSKLTTVPKTEESKQLTNQTSKDCHRKFFITILIILLVEAPQVVCAWITIAEKMPQFRNQHFPAIEVIQHLVK